MGKVEKARDLVMEVRELAKKYNANFLFVTDGASGYSNGIENTSHVLKEMRNHLIDLERKNGLNPYKDWTNDSD